MKKIILTFVISSMISLLSLGQASNKYVSKAGHIKFFSHTAIEDIKADNYKVISTINSKTGDIVFSVPMQAFEFKKRLMQKHYNGKKFLNTKKFPKSKFKGKITNLASIDFAKDGTYSFTAKGSMTMHGITKAIEEKGTLTVKGGEIKLDLEMDLVLADYEISFKKGKPSRNIAKKIKVTVKAIHKKKA